MTKILISEDEADIRDLIMFTLQMEGYEVIVTNNGVEAVERTVTEQPDMVLLDVRMPRMTGYEACEKIKADPRTAHIPIVFLSAKGQETEVRAGMGAGAMAYILKPFAPDILLHRIKNLLADAKKKAEARAAKALTPAPQAKPEAVQTPAAKPAASPPDSEDTKPVKPGAAVAKPGTAAANPGQKPAAKPVEKPKE